MGILYKTPVELRQALHQHPELSGREKQTFQRISDFLDDFDPDEMVKNIGGYGLMASYIFSEHGPEIVIRCEMDALPIQDVTHLPHASATAGVSHKCGHDGHMAIVAGIAQWLSTRPFQSGKVRLLFQPAEENGKGAQAMLADMKMADFSPDYMFALHNLPGYPLHEIVVVRRQFNATVQSMAIFFSGVAAHAAHPESGRNPSLAISEACITLDRLSNPDPADPAFALVTPVYTRIGAPDYGISAAEGEAHFTLRTWSEKEMSRLQDSILAVTSGLCEKYELAYTTQQFDYFPTVVNDEQCIEVIIAAAKQLNYKVTELTSPMRFGEDFGFFTRKGKGAMFGLGAGLQTPPLHNQAYDFPDVLLETGMSMFKGIISKLLESGC